MKNIVKQNSAGASGPRASIPSAQSLSPMVTPTLTQPVMPDIPTMPTPSFSSGSSRMALVSRYNRWRERYNPLRSLTIARAVTLLESYQRGEMADPQWTYFFIEQSDADLFAIIERREAALLELDWNIKLASGRRKDSTPREGYDLVLAREQAAALRESYEAIDNLYEAFSHLQLATFRGFSHLEKYRDTSGEVFHLEIVDQWNMVRDLLRGQWKYNPGAVQATFYNLPEENLVEPGNFIIRERDRHVNRIALLKFIRANLCDKDWDAFIEIYGIPSGVVIGPPGVEHGREADYQASAQNIADGGSGYLPYGSNYIPNDQPRGTSPFQMRLEYLSQKLVLAGTGGLLTMLTQSGSGTLAGGAHMEAFQSIARAEARKLSELFQRQHDRELLNAKFPGLPHLAYFELAANDETDPGAIADHAQKFHAAGYKMDASQLSERSGYTLWDEKEGQDSDLLAPSDENAEEEDAESAESDAELDDSAAEDASLQNRAGNPDAELVTNRDTTLESSIEFLLGKLAAASGENFATELALFNRQFPEHAHILNGLLGGGQFLRKLLRWPAGSPKSMGGQFMPKLGMGTGGTGKIRFNRPPDSALPHPAPGPGRKPISGTPRSAPAPGRTATPGRQLPAPKKKTPHAASPEEGQKSSTSQIKRKKSLRGTDSPAGKIIRAELEKIEGKKPLRSLERRLVSQKSALSRVYHRHRELQFAPHQRKHIASRGEHIVEHFGKGRVLKHTHSGFGLVMDFKHVASASSMNIKAYLRDALPTDYLHRMDANHAVFKDYTRAEGVTRVGKRLGLAVSQKLFKGTHPELSELELLMKSKGFHKVSARAFEFGHDSFASGKTWFRPKTGHMVSDVKPDNFIKTRKGKIHPIDLITHHFEPTHPLHALFSANLIKE